MLSWLRRKAHSARVYLLGGLLGVVGGGCSLMSETEGWPLEDKPPVTGQASPDEEYKVPSTTKVLSEEGIAQLETITNEGTLLFPKDSPYAQSLEQGDVIVAGVSDKTPSGLLRRVSEVVQDTSRIRVQTTQASLEEAVEEGSLRTHIDFSKAYLEQTSTGPDVETRSDALRGELHEEGTLEIDFGNTNPAPGIEINGRAQLTVGMDLEIEIKRFTLEHFKLGITGSEKLALEFIAAYERAYETTLPPVEPFPLKPFTIWTWGIPIVIFPHYSITLGFEAGARIDLSAAIEQEARAEIALVYKRETGFVHVSDFQNSYGLRYDPDFVGITGKGELFAKHKLLFAPYNIGGAFVSFRGGVGAEVTPDELVVYANLGVGAGAELRSLKHEMEEAGAEGEGEGEGIDVTSSIEIPLYTHRKDLLRKRLEGREPAPDTASFCGVYSFKGTIEEISGHCQERLRGQERDLELIINVEGNRITARDNFGVEYTGEIEEGNARFEAAEQSIEVGPNCNVVFRGSFSGRLTEEVLQGTVIMSLSAPQGAGCGGFVYENADCRQTIVGQGTKKESLPECTIPEEIPPPLPCIDSDRDGYGENCRRPDCDDSNPVINLGMDEVCNGIDDDCDGRTDGDCPRIRYVIRVNNEPSEIVTADSGTGAIISRFSLAQHQGYTGYIGKKSPTRNELILGAGLIELLEEGSLGMRVVDSETGDIIREYPTVAVVMRGAVYIAQAVWLPDGNTIAAFSPETLNLIDRETGQVIGLDIDIRGRAQRGNPQSKIGLCPVFGRTELALVMRHGGTVLQQGDYLTMVDYIDEHITEWWKIPDGELYDRNYNALACSPRRNQYALQIPGRIRTLQEEENGLVNIGFGSYHSETNPLTPVWSPNGESIAVSDIRNGSREILLVDRLDADAVRVRQLTNTPNQDETNPDFTQ